ncbi:hypothetical protein AB4068_15620 [Arthrobacter sp. 2RAF22]|uniref:hypothetical protein n=1 Tax=Arthrobacter sp. 2RAF22 TaxID=3232996 RepID=UPI003F905BD7
MEQDPPESTVLEQPHHLTIRHRLIHLSGCQFLSVPAGMDPATHSADALDIPAGTGGQGRRRHATVPDVSRFGLASLLMGISDHPVVAL